MKLPDNSVAQYRSAIRKIEALLKDATSPDIDYDALHLVQRDLDKLAEKIQHDESLGANRYKLYELQALIHYFNNEDTQAIDFIEQAVEMHGESYQKAERLIERINQPKKQLQKWDILFFHKSPVTVGLLSFFTLNIYSIYWFYKHWHAIRLSTGESTFPILSSIFQIFTVYPLFKKIRNASAKSGHTQFKFAGLAATGYIIVSLLNNAGGKYDIKSQSEAIGYIFITVLFGAFIALILSRVQAAANAHNLTSLGKQYSFRKYFPGEIIFSIIGIAVFTLTCIYSVSAIAARYPVGTESEIDYQSKKVDTLRSEYDACSSALKLRGDAVDTTSEDDVNGYNNDLSICESKRQELNTAVDKYNYLIGY